MPLISRHEIENSRTDLPPFFRGPPEEGVTRLAGSRRRRRRRSVVGHIQCELARMRNVSFHALNDTAPPQADAPPLLSE